MRASSMLVLLALGLACNNGEEPGQSKPTDPEDPDVDGDGFPASEDCDDQDAAVNPDADELCDGIDNNCDGELDDESASDTSEWYADADADGFGDADQTIAACDPPEGFAAEAGDCDDADPEVHPAAEEICDGIDNDCDGTIDGPESVDASTWYADTDGDGFGDPDAPVVDCPGDGLVEDASDCDDADAEVNPDAEEAWYDLVDSDCDGDPDPDVCEEVPGGAFFAEDPTCTYTPMPPSSWSIQTEWTTDPASGWTWSVGNSYTHVMMTPVVGQLTDDNGDGLINERDTPDIAFNTFSSYYYSSAGYLRVVSGDGGGEHFSVSTATDGTGSWSIAASGGIALGDIDADGSPDMVTIAAGGAAVLALEADGTLKWAQDAVEVSRYAYPFISDMDGDGLAEIIVGTEIYDHDGTHLATAPSGSGYSAFAADLDNDGVLEHIGGTSVTAMDGTPIWDQSSVSTGHGAVMDWDGDGDGDVLNQYGGTLTVFDESGNTLLTSTIAGNANGAPCVGDLDGDGEPEVAITGENAVTAMETDGSVMWTATSSDYSSRGTPCTAWDFDGDGDFEVLVADERQFRIFDGTNGTALLTETGHASGTLREQPVPVDVDRDGNTEIVLASNDYAYGGWDGVTVLGEVNDEWTTTRTTWNQGVFWSGNINEDMSIPTATDMPWDLDNSFRSQRSPTADPLATQDYEVEILGVCEDCTEGMVEVWVSPLNSGAVWGPAGIDVALYMDDGTSETLLEVQQTTSTIDAGERLAPMTFMVDVDTFNSGSLIARVDCDADGLGSHNECDEANNEATWSDPVCTD